MKHGGIKAVCLVVLLCMAVLSAYGQAKTVNLTSIVLDSFDGDSVHEWHDGRHPRRFEFSWALSASRFATRTTDSEGNEVQFPLMSFIETWPVALFGHRPPEEGTRRSLGLHGRFDRRGYNWIDLYPVTPDGDPFEIPMPGRVHHLDMWVWGSNLDYYIEAYVRDYRGVVHAIRLGNIAYTGWRNLRASIPNHIRQERRVLPNFAQLHFVKFRIWTQPQEQVGNFYIYFKQFNILTDTFENFFDGNELADPDLIPQFWAGGVSASDQ